MNHSPAHTPKLGATIHYLPSFRNGTVSIHAPAWGATCRGCPLLDVVLVSIHAPAWGATIFSYCLHTFAIVSIHAPAWGATLAHVADCHAHYCFNPRSRIGSDVCRDRHRGKTSVSIHAPTWGATRHAAMCRARRMFQSTLPRGERQGNLFGMTAYNGFNPRSHVGSDNTSGSRWSTLFCFNPRSRVGSDDPETNIFLRNPVSIHAPAWGATRGAVKRPYCATVSIHAPAWGATGVLDARGAELQGFNPRSRVGSDHAKVVEATKKVVSIHAPAWGATC